MPATPRHLIRRAVRRPGADSYLRLMLASFVISLLGTRVYLALAGYPQIGGEVLHIAHALWGGLLLIVASLLPLVVANRWVFPWVAVLSGVGTGLFVDEVGKFITTENDYFFPAAAPIVYATFLLTMFVYLQVRRPKPLDARAELYAALEGMEDVLDHDLEERERDRLQARLDRVLEKTDSPDLRRLAESLKTFLASDASVAPTKPGFWRRQRARWDAITEGWINEGRLRLALAVGLTGLGILALSDTVVIGTVLVDSADGETSELAELADRLARIEVGDTALPVLLVRAVLDALLGLGYLASAAMLVKGWRINALRLAYYALLAALTVVNLMIFYFEQFLAAASAAAQFLMLYLVSYYRRRYLPRADPGDPA